MSAVGFAVSTMVVTIKQGTAAAVAYECAITGVVVNESHDTVTSRTGCADGSIVDAGPSSYTLTVNANTSLAPTSLYRLLSEHAGQSAVVSVEPFPVKEPGHKIEMDVTLVPAGSDFTVGSIAAFSVELPVAGAPRFIDPTP